MATPTSPVAYELDGPLPESVAPAVDSGSSILISGPSLTQKPQLTLQLQARGARDGHGALCVTTRDPAVDVAERYRELLGGADQHRWFIDAAGTSEAGSKSGNAPIRYIASPDDLTGIGIEFSDVAEAAEQSTTRGLRVGFDSLSMLLQYTDLQRSFRFLHVFTSQISARDWLGLFTLDPEAHDEQAVSTIKQLFDGVIELREREDGSREVRTQGLSTGSTEFQPLE